MLSKLVQISSSKRSPRELTFPQVHWNSLSLKDYTWIWSQSPESLRQVVNSASVWVFAFSLLFGVISTCCWHSFLLWYAFPQMGFWLSACVCDKLFQLCLTPCDSMDCSPPGSSVHGILQARILEWVAMPSSMGSSRPRDRTCVSYVSCISRWVLYHQRHLGSPLTQYLLPIQSPGLWAFMYLSFSFLPLCLPSLWKTKQTKKLDLCKFRAMFGPEMLTPSLYQAGDIGFSDHLPSTHVDLVEHKDSLNLTAFTELDSRKGTRESVCVTKSSCDSSTLWGWGSANTKEGDALE